MQFNLTQKTIFEKNLKMIENQTLKANLSSIKSSIYQLTQGNDPLDINLQMRGGGGG